jgi:two-component system CheB/CheR fusion protein
MPKSARPATLVPGHVVALGASAGGLNPLMEVLAGFEPGQGLAFIVVQHLAHAHTSALVALLQPHTRMAVLEATDGQVLRPDQVYVITPGTGLTLVDAHLAVRRLGPEPTPAHQIDELFASLAVALGRRAVGVVLSGMGNDGSVGLRRIVDAQGAGFAQSPETAQFDSMPRAAAAIGRGVWVATPAELPGFILKSTHGPARRTAPVAAALASDSGELAAALTQVALVTRHDFSQYKTSTMRRRIERRMAIHGSASLDDYVRLLAASSQEAQLLFKELLIGVTSFLRDPPVWDTLQASVLPGLLAHAAAGHGVRAWVAGCSSGEEAYTLAMLLREGLDTLPAGSNCPVQIFATDLSADAIQTARRGVYPATAIAGLSAARQARFFSDDGGRVRVAKSLREMVLFAQHDVIVDPPFTRLDLVSCRNLLIYFKAPLQRRLLQLFHYALRPGGCLVLGNAETTGRVESLFQAVDATLRIHRRADASVADAAHFFPVKPTMRDDLPDVSTPAAGVPAAGTGLQSMADRLMLSALAPPAVLVGEDDDILYVNGRTGRFLEPTAGKANWNVHAMARDGLGTPLAAALRQVRAEGRVVELRGLTVEPGAAAIGVDVSLMPVQLPGHSGLVLIVFRDAALPPQAAAARPRRVRHDSELRHAQDESQALREEMRASKEELQSANEELQSTNEELTTSKEEMQAMNEELQTVNAELLSRLNDLALVQSDLQNLLNSTQIATLFLDGAMNVRRFTEQAKRVIRLRDSDIGRPLSDLTTTLDYPAMNDDIAQVLRTLEFRETEVRTSDARWFAVRIMPYRTQDNVIDGSVITFADITAAKDLEARLRVATAPPAA